MVIDCVVVCVQEPDELAVACDPALPVSVEGVLGESEEKVLVGVPA